MLCLVGMGFGRGGATVSLMGAKEAGKDDGGSVLGGLETSIDKSIDDRVTAYLSIPEMSSMPVPCDQTSGCASGANWWQGGIIGREEKTYLEGLLQTRRALEHRKEHILRNLRLQRNLAAETAAKGMVSMETSALHRALKGAEQRVSEESQKWGRLLAAKVHAATLAQDHAMSVEHVTLRQNAEMDSMLSIARRQ